MQVADDPVDVEHDGRQHLLSAEGEKLARERRRLVGGLAGALGMGAEWILGGQPPQHQIAVAADDHEQVVEVVRDAARELADGIHLLGLAELFLGLAEGLRGALVLREIDGDTAELDGAAARPEPDVDDVAQPHLAPVRGERAVLELVVQAPRDGVAARRRDAGPIVGMDARHEELRLPEPVLVRSRG